MIEKKNKKVEFRFHYHHRRIDPISSTIDNPRGVLPKGGVTVAVIKYEGEDTMKFAVEVCCIKDTFSKKTGRKNAYLKCQEDGPDLITSVATSSFTAIREMSKDLAEKEIKKRKFDIIKSQRTTEEIEKGINFHVQNKLTEISVNKELNKIISLAKKKINKSAVIKKALLLMEEEKKKSNVNNNNNIASSTRSKRRKKMERRKKREMVKKRDVAEETVKTMENKTDLNKN